LDRNSTPGSVREISKYVKAEVRLTRFSTVSPPGKKTTESQSDAWQSRAHNRARNSLNEDRPYVYEKSVVGITLHQTARSDSGDLIRVQHSRIEDWVHEIANAAQIAYVSESQVVPELMPEIHIRHVRCCKLRFNDEIVAPYNRAADKPEAGGRGSSTGGDAIDKKGIDDQGRRIVRSRPEQLSKLRIRIDIEKVAIDDRSRLENSDGYPLLAEDRLGIDVG
jgi:hypothetical protein